ncbi:MAG: hypothetical protein A2921_00555 [Candidatus Magasanikbacteria bacterium RIFCSPLOWO2_01_FULL_43_20b]|nr:MAG: hypothetical protein A3C74_04080 [Candidatus Magasanikbacteria bacterium RIFCSPHIGHO2_02_FULL_44_13]OGH72904.1 MAG: hypothetical protein A2921_00555 [Candidatus Magasanikbacteria bacterium RIFCSPLOWO2_01_FULL_43_20b]
MGLRRAPNERLDVVWKKRKVDGSSRIRLEPVALALAVRRHIDGLGAATVRRFLIGLGEIDAVAPVHDVVVCGEERKHLLCVLAKNAIDDELAAGVKAFKEHGRLDSLDRIHPTCRRVEEMVGHVLKHFLVQFSGLLELLVRLKCQQGIPCVLAEVAVGVQPAALIVASEDQ